MTTHGHPKDPGRGDEWSDQAVDALFDFAGERQPGRSSLTVMGQAMALLGQPQHRLRAVHITGTSGKTSTSYYLRALLEAAGQRTGLTVSPHIGTINERVQIDGHPLAPTLFSAALDRLLDQLAPLRGQLTYFELCVCLALAVFADQGVDYAVVEVGIGGDRDATNIMQRSDKLALIGPVGLDHTEKLGDSVAEVAGHKAGIIVPAGQAIVVDQSAEALAVIRRRVDQIGAKLMVVDPATVAWTEPLAHTGSNQPSALATTADGQRPRSGAVTRSVPSYQRGNWALACQAVTYLARRDGFQLPDWEILQSVRQVTPPARYEWFDLPGHRLLLDGAHNPQKMAGLVQGLQGEGLTALPTLATLSTAPQSKVDQTLAVLAPVVSHLIVPQFVLGHDGKVKTSLPADQVAAAARRLGLTVETTPDPASGLDRLLSFPSFHLLVTGSLYLAALVRPRLVAAQRG